MAESEKPDDNPVSFTDTNAETGMGGGGKMTTSTMNDLIGGLKKQKEMEAKEKESNKDQSSKSEVKKKGKKKKKKGKKGKYKKMRKNDRYESQNYLLRIEGSICCASIVMAGLWVVLTAILLLVIIIVTQGDFKDIFLVEEIKKNADSKEATTKAPSPPPPPPSPSPTTTTAAAP